jgi:pimeloyl-ACP methyl ester carboxylesterase
MGRALRRTAAIAVFSALISIGAAVPAAGVIYDPSPPGANDFSCKPSTDHPRPVVLVHGLGATMSENWSYQSPRIKAAGYCVFALTYGVDPRTALLPTAPGGVVAMERSAPELKAFVDRVLSVTGAAKVDIVGHSEGTVMPRYYLERLGGKSKVKRFVALTPLWRGTEVAGTAFLRDFAAPFGLSDPIINLVASFCGSCPEFLRGSAYLNDLNADGEAVPGIVHTNVVTRYDELVVPYTSGIMSDGGTNIVLQDICPANVDEHVALAFDPVVTQLILNALDPEHATAVRC